MTVERPSRRPLLAPAALSLGIALVAAVFGVLTLAGPAVAPAPPPAPTMIDLELVITGRGAIGGPAESHLYNPQMMVVRRGDTVRLRVINQSFFRHGIEITGYGLRTRELTGGPAGSDTLTFTADKVGIFEYRCYIPYDPVTATCAPDHDQMIGHLVVIDAP